MKRAFLLLNGRLKEIKLLAQEWPPTWTLTVTGPGAMEGKINLLRDSYNLRQDGEWINVVLYVPCGTPGIHIIDALKEYESR